MEKKKLLELNVNEHTEKQNGFTYLSWAWAWTEIIKENPDASYEVHLFDGKPYVFDENLGYMVFTSVTIGGDTKHMQLPVMNGANKAQKHIAYEYETKFGPKKVEPATMFDINTAIMRCLTKNLALFGLGLYIYAGEDVPVGEESEDKPKSEPTIRRER
jgi:uncharacterized protein YhbP (UPF0306 family)